MSEGGLITSERGFDNNNHQHHPNLNSNCNLNHSNNKNTLSMMAQMDRHSTNPDQSSSGNDDANLDTSSPNVSTTTTPCAQHELSSPTNCGKSSLVVNMDNKSQEQTQNSDAKLKGETESKVTGDAVSQDEVVLKESMSRKESVSRSNSDNKNSIDDANQEAKRATLVEQSSLSPSTPPFVSLAAKSDHQTGQDLSNISREKDKNMEKDESSSASGNNKSSSASASATIGFGTIDASCLSPTNDVADGPCLSKWSSSPFKSSDAKDVVKANATSMTSSAQAQTTKSTEPPPPVLSKNKMDEEFPPVDASFPPLAATVNASSDHGHDQSSDGYNNNNNDAPTTPIKGKQTPTAATGLTPVPGSGKKKGKAAWKPLTVEFNTKPLSDRDIRGQSGRLGRKGRDDQGGHSGFRRNVPSGSVSSDGGQDEFRGRRRFTDGSQSAGARGPFGGGGGGPRSGFRGSPFAGNGGPGSASPRSSVMTSPVTLRTPGKKGGNYVPRPDNLPPGTTTTHEYILTPDGTVVPATIHHVHHHAHIHVHHPLAMPHGHTHHHAPAHSTASSSTDGPGSGRGTPNGYLSSTTSCSTPTSIAAAASSSVIHDGGENVVSYSVSSADPSLYFIPVTTLPTVVSTSDGFASVVAVPSPSTPTAAASVTKPSSKNTSPASSVPATSTIIAVQAVVSSSSSPQSIVPSSSVTTTSLGSPTTLTTVVAVPTTEGGYTLATVAAPGAVPVTTSLETYYGPSVQSPVSGTPLPPTVGGYHTSFAPITITSSMGSNGQTVVQAVAIGPTGAIAAVIPETEESLKAKIRTQIEYYFSDKNLERDMFIRRKMDADGYLAIAMIASFHRVQMLTQDLNLIIDSLLDSELVQLSDNHLKARPKKDPTKWPISDQNVQNEGPVKSSYLVNGDAAAQSSASTATNENESSPSRGVGSSVDGDHEKRIKTKLAVKNGGLKHLTNGDSPSLASELETKLSVNNS